jgi:hypothetical protein
MTSNYKEEWNKYLFEDGVEYSMEEVFEIIKRMLEFLRSRRMRIDATMWINPNQYSYMYLLSNEEIKKYLKYFEDKQFTTDSARIIVNGMGVAYHYFDITFDEALDFADYISQNRITFTQGAKDKFNVDFNEIQLFLDDVMVKNAEFCIAQVIKHGQAFCEALEALVKEINKQ